MIQQHETDRSVSEEARSDPILIMFINVLNRVTGENPYKIYDEDLNLKGTGFFLFGAGPYLSSSGEEYEYPSILLELPERRVTYRDRNGEIVISNVRVIRKDGEWGRIAGERNIDGQNVACVFSVCKLGRTDISPPQATPLVNAA